MNITNKIAIVTGGASGLGKVIAGMLMSCGAKVVVIDVNSQALNALNENDCHLKINCDVTKHSDISNAIEIIIQRFHKIDILVNNAGVLFSAPLINLMSKELKHSIEAWQKVIDVNLTAPFFISSCVVKQMVIKRTKGVIINISSISASGNAGQSAYSAAKAGVEALTKVWSKELGGFGIRCVAVSPGYVNTGSTSNAVTQSVLDHVKSETPLNRLAHPNEIAEGVIFSIQNNFLNGTVLEINGGLTI